jgi:hypothetical protein
MKQILDFLNWHKQEYGHAYNHQNDLIETAKKATLYADYVFKNRVNVISDEEIKNAFPINNIKAIKGAIWFKEQLLKQ